MVPNDFVYKVNHIIIYLIFFKPLFLHITFNYLSFLYFQIDYFVKNLINFLQNLILNYHFSNFMVNYVVFIN